MRLNLGRARVLLFEVPRTAKLAYCLMRDERVPLGPKVAVGAALGLIVSPFDVPAWIPVIGDLDALALGILAVKVFVDACPDEVVADQRAALERGDSVFDNDLRAGLELGRGAVHRLLARRRATTIGLVEGRNGRVETAAINSSKTRRPEDRPA